MLQDAKKDPRENSLGSFWWNDLCMNLDAEGGVLAVDLPGGLIAVHGSEAQIVRKHIVMVSRLRDRISAIFWLPV